MNNDKKVIRRLKTQIKTAREELLHLFILRKPGRQTLTYRCIKRAVIALGYDPNVPKSWFATDPNPKREPRVF